MKINSGDKLNFATLGVGAVFSYGGDVYMKVEAFKDDPKSNAINLKTTSLTIFTFEALVSSHPRAELTLETIK